MSRRTFRIFLWSPKAVCNISLYHLKKLTKNRSSYSNRSSSPKIREILPKVQLEKFTSCLPTIVNDLTNPKTGCMAEIPEVAKRIEDIMFYNLTTGKKTISQIFLSAFWALVAPQNLNEDRLFSAHVLSWTIQMVWIEGASG